MFRKIAEIGLKKQYQEDENLKKFVKKIISLALVPIDKVQDVFVELCEFEKPEYEQIDLFLDYMTETYIDPDQALFPIETWNQYDDTDNKRTNNDIEGYNLWLSLWLHKHPNIWNFIKKIKVEESTTLIKFHNINNGILKTKSRSTKDVTRDEDIL